jgi:hypothetical protein
MAMNEVEVAPRQDASSRRERNTLGVRGCKRGVLEEGWQLGRYRTLVVVRAGVGGDVRKRSRLSFCWRVGQELQVWACWPHHVVLSPSLDCGVGCLRHGVRGAAL